MVIHMDGEVTENSDKNKVERKAGVQRLNSSMSEWVPRAGTQEESEGGKVWVQREVKSEFRGTGHFEEEESNY